jgi:peptidoglycan/xylan/chitin deacetylase (PgdA/CDA1 family)
MIHAARTRIKAAALTIARRHPAARNHVMRAAAKRGRSLVLCYHCVAPDGGGEHAIEPIPPWRFADQMRALKEAGDVVDLGDLLSLPSARGRPAFAVTFDDDEPSLVQHALPILRELDIPATFFLSGRSLHGLGPYWWTLVERSVVEIGLEATSRLIGHRGLTLREMVRSCRISGIVPALRVRDTPSVMATRDVRMLADAGMTIGFHTLHHLALPALDGPRLAEALSEGRGALSAAAGVPIDFLAYPYGLADHRVAHAARVAGYRAAWVTGNRPMTRESDAFLLPRWQPGAVDGVELLGEMALRLTAAGLSR